MPDQPPLPSLSDLNPQAPELGTALQVGGAPAPPIVRRTGPPGLGDSLLAYGGRPEWGNDRIPLPDRVGDFLSLQARVDRPWDQVQAEAKQRFNIDGGESLQSQFKLERARTTQSTEGESDLEFFARRSMPVGSAVGNAAREKRLKIATDRFAKGEATEDDYTVIARAERLGEIDAETTATLGGQLKESLAHIPAFVGEIYGGKVIAGAGRAALLARAGQTGARGAELAVGAIRAADATGAVGRTTASTVAAPSFWLEEGTKEYLTHPDQNMFQAYAPRLAYATAQVAVLGSLGKAAGGVPTIPGRLVARTGIGLAEQQSLDVGSSALDQAVRQTTGRSLGLDTGYGTLGSLYRGDEEGLKHAAVQAATFAAFSAMHAPGELKSQALRQPIGGPEAKAPAKPRPDPITRTFADALDDMAHKGLPTTEASRRMTAISNRFERLLQEDSATAWETARDLHKDERLSEPEAAYAREVGKAVSERLKAEAGKPPEAVKRLAPEMPEGGFRTEKGSAYEVHDDGTTTRNKAARDLPGHEGDSGIKDRSAKTVYVPPEVASALSSAGLHGLGPEGSRLMLRTDPSGKVTASLLTWNKDANSWGATASGRDVPVSDKPTVGLHPLELWGRSDVLGNEAYTKQHAGSRITEVSQPVEAPRTAEPTPQAIPQPEPQNVPASDLTQPGVTRLERSVEGLSPEAIGGIEPMAPVLEVVTRAGLGDRAEVLEDGTGLKFYVGDKFVSLHRSGDGAVLINFDDLVKKSETSATDRTAGVKAGTFDLKADLTRVAEGLHAAGLKIMFDASTKAGESGGRANRASAYGAILKRVGFEREKSDAVKGMATEVWAPTGKPGRQAKPRLDMPQAPESVVEPKRLSPPEPAPQAPIGAPVAPKEAALPKRQAQLARYREQSAAKVSDLLSRIDRGEEFGHEDVFDHFGLSEAERYVLGERMPDMEGNQRTFAEIGEEAGKTKQWVKQIEENAFAKMGREDTGYDVFRQGVEGQKASLRGKSRGVTVEGSDPGQRGEVSSHGKAEQVKEASLRRADEDIKAIMDEVRKHPEKESELYAEYEKIVAEIERVEATAGAVYKGREAVTGRQAKPVRPSEAAGAAKPVPGPATGEAVGGEGGSAAPGPRIGAPTGQPVGAPRPVKKTPEQIDEFLGGKASDFAFGANADVETAAARMLADRIADTPGRSTAAQASFGPAALQGPSIVAREREAAARYLRAIRDHFTELGGGMFPRTTRFLARAADAMARFISAPQYAHELTPVLIDKVIPNGKGEPFMQLVGGVLTEMRLRFMRIAYLDYGKKVVAKAEATLAAAQTPKEKAKAEAVLAKAKEAAKKANKRAKKVRSIVGQPPDAGGDVLASPFLTEADYQHALRDPEVQASIAAYKEHVVPIIEANFRKAMGLAPDAAIDSLTQIPGLPINLRAIRPGETGEGLVRFGGGTRAGNLENPKLHRLQTSKQATGASKLGYHISIGTMIENSMSLSTELAAKADMYRTLVSGGLAKWGKGTPAGYEHKLAEATPPKGTQEAKEGERRLYFKDESVMKEVRKALDVDLPWKAIPGTGILNMATLASLGEFTAHSKNLLTMQFKKGMSIVGTVRNAIDVIRQTPEVRDRIVELARIGALKPKGYESQATGFLGRIGQSNLNPLKWTGKVLDVLDRASRLTASEAFDKIAKRDGVDASEGSRRDFINQLGQYNKRAQSHVVRFLRDTGLGPFATAGSNYFIQGVRSMVGGHGVRTTSTKAEVALRSQQMLGRTLAFMAAAPVVNYLLWGSVFGDDDTPIGAIKLSEGKDGRSQYFDLTALTGVTRGMRETGLLAMAESAREQGKPLPRSSGEVADRAARDIGHAVSHPAQGPLVAFLETLVSGENTIGRRTAKPATEGESQTVNNLQAALIQANPLIAAGLQLTGHDPMERRTDTGREVLRQLGPFGVKSGQSDMGQTFELRKRFLAEQGLPAEPGGPSKTGKMRDAALDDDYEAFVKAREAYLDLQRRGGSAKPGQDFLESLNRLDPIKGHLNAVEERKFLATLSPDQRATVDRARAQAKETRVKMLEMWRRAAAEGQRQPSLISR